jgi:YidC/Oxa1 family membrane protein insertase
MIALVWWQALLDGLGAVLAFFYKYVPNYGLAIILLTLAIRVLLLPLAVKQIRSMQAMQAIQPKVKDLQRKFKGNRERLNQEMMALYKEHGVNPLSGCLPLLAQFPVLIALFAVLRFPQGLTHIPHNDGDPVIGIEHSDSRLYVDLVHQHADFLGINLLCNASQAGSTVKLDPKSLNDVADLRGQSLDCGSGFPVRIPYYLLAVLMVGTTYIQQRQMQRASPSGSQQQQALTRIMPLLFGVWGIIFPAGLVIYWSTTNGVQILQQRYMLAKQEQLAGRAPERGGDSGRSDGQGKGDELRKPGPTAGDRGPRGSQDGAARPRPGGGRPQPQGARGGRNARDRKKRRKR